MGHVQPRHRKFVEEQLQPGEQLRAIMHTHTGKTTPATTSVGGVSRYVQQHGLVFKGVAGVVDLFDTWLVLTDRRLAFFKGSWFTLRPGPKKHILDVAVDDFTLRWRPEHWVKDYLLIDLAFPNDEHLVTMAEPDEDSQTFIDALGERARQV